ncbi:MAG: Rieske (2Fe-2S) protein [Anaerolineae bacterium]|nr:Rieske (2Fe-2S) protein [Candidatus Roseilinea sp.]MDW8451470.1 Rieske (2Fe-2S) protein [Anaerolineae bacterium]
MTIATSALVFAARLSELRAKGCLTATVDGHIIALFDYGGKVYAVDNRCPHMGFPLDRGSVKDGILTCHWHHARFDLASGGAFDLWADDVRTFPVEVRGDEIWVDVAPHTNLKAHLRRRLRDGLERNLSLVIAKSVIGLAQTDEGAVETFHAGLEFGARYRRAGWGPGLTILTCMMNLLPHLAPEDRPRALYHGLSAVARDTDGMPPRFIVQPLPGVSETRVLRETGIPGLKRWFRRFIEVRDAEGAERCIASAVRAGAAPQQLADMLFAAATDHRYIDVGHPLDFTNKALEALDVVGWTPANAELVLTSLVNGYANAERMEESNAWRNPIDLVEMLERAFEQLEDLHHEDARSRSMDEPSRQRLVAVLLGDDPQAIVDALLRALREGVSDVDLAGVVAYAAALRIARFHTSNEFGDWDTALHTFTFANAVHQGLRRTHSHELLRGVFDAAMSIYLDRFLNVPAARIPSPNGKTRASLDDLPALLDRQQQVDAAGDAVAQLLYSGTPPREVIAMLGRLLLREDRDFHTIQCVEAAVRQHEMLEGTPAAHVLIAAARYLAAHAPTMRAQGQTFNIAQRLARGEKLFEEAAQP